jgi:hypothetical protein
MLMNLIKLHEEAIFSSNLGILTKELTILAYSHNKNKYKEHY